MLVPHPTGDKYVTVTIDMTPIRGGTSPARPLDMVQGRSKQAHQRWLADRPQPWRDAVDRCRRRVQLDTSGHRGHKGDPLYAARRTLHTGAGPLTEKQYDRPDRLFADDLHVEVEATGATSR